MEPAEGVKEYKLKEIDVSKLGDKKDAVGQVIVKISKPLFDKPPRVAKEGEEVDEDEELDEEDDEAMSGIEQRMAADIKKTLDTDLGGNWNTLVGDRFSALVNHLPKDRYGAFEFGPVAVHIFEMNNY